MEKVKVPTNLNDKFTSVYQAANELKFSVENDKARIEVHIQESLLDKDLGLPVTDNNWKSCRMAGALRRVFKECAQLDTPALEPPKKASTSASSTQAQAPATQNETHHPMPQLFQERIPPVITKTEVDQLKAQFEQEYTCEVLTHQVTPARDYLRHIKHQVNTCRLEWLPWTPIVSKHQEDVAIHNGTVKTRNKTGLSDGAAMLTMLEGEFCVAAHDHSGSPHSITHLLSTRAHAMAMLHLCHISWVKALDAKMMTAYTQKCDPSSAQRAINAAELQHADRVFLG